MPAHTERPSPSDLHRIRFAEAMLLRVPAMVIVLIFRLDRPFRAKEVATLLGIDYQAARRYLRDLSHPEVGLLTRTRQGWRLAASGRLRPPERRKIGPGHPTACARATRCRETPTATRTTADVMRVGWTRCAAIRSGTRCEGGDILGRGGG